jgi:dihydrofolate synthase / folylpolyglutamate synthase
MSAYLLHMPHWPRPLGPQAAGTPSERTRSLLDKLHRPERRLPPVVHVGGTKGKGSTIAILRAMLEAAGFRVHAYTTPHLQRFNERIVLAGNEIDDDTLFRVIEEVRLAAGDMPVGFFDATTAAAILAFAGTPADILLMEMGLGGTVDATNIIDNPRLTILTTLSLDHTEYMGTTLPQIAAFEAGLFKPDVPCIVSYQHESVWPVLEAKAQAPASPLYAYGRHWLTRRAKNTMTYVDANGEAQLPLPALLGAHQTVNAGNAIAAISALTEFDIPPHCIAEGLLRAQWKGRLQRMNIPSLPQGSELWFDGGHNGAAAEAVSFFAREQWVDKPLYLIFGSTRSKDITAMLSPFVPIIKGVYVVKVKSEPKSFTAEELTQLCAPLTTASPMESIEDALGDIVKHETHPFRTLIFGSLYLWLETSLL